MHQHIVLKYLVAVIALAFSSLGPALAQVANPWDPFPNGRPPAPKKQAPPQPPAAQAPPQTGNPEAGQPYDPRPPLRPMDGFSAPAQPAATQRQPDFAYPGNGVSATPGITAGRPLPPPGQTNQTPGYQTDGTQGYATPSGIERADLSPIMASDGSDLPYELWRGLDLQGVEKLLSTLKIPPASPALHKLWTRLIASAAPLSQNPETDINFQALRLQARYRSGLGVTPGRAGLENQNPAATNPVGQPGTQNPVLTVLTARNDVVSGDPKNACADLRRIEPNAVPDALKSETVALFGLCAVRSGNTAATELAASLTREFGANNSVAAAALDAITAKAAVELPQNGTITGIDYRLLEQAKYKPSPAMVARAEPALLVVLANDRSLYPDTRAAAAEQAARLNAISPAALANVYRETANARARSGQNANAPITTGTTGQLEQPANKSRAAISRALRLQALEREYTPFKKARLVRSFLDDARRAGLYYQALVIASEATSNLRPVPELSWFSESAIEISLAAGDYPRARDWARMTAQSDPRSTGQLDHWLALIDIADPKQRTRRGENLNSVENMALTGRFRSDHLHRLATVLDALDYDVPIPLWEAASRTPQPNTGHLPESGVLTRLQDAAKNREFGRTILLVMKTLGPDGPQGAHMIALGDSIRALKRANLEADARRLGFEALFAIWPRVTSR